jgi:hypothetical protein
MVGAVMGMAKGEAGVVAEKRVSALVKARKNMRREQEDSASRAAR